MTTSFSVAAIIIGKQILCSNLKMVDKFVDISTRCSGHPQSSSEAIHHNKDEQSI